MVDTKKHTNLGRSKKRLKIESYLDRLYAIDYRERPVDIITFLKEDYYLGKSTNNLKAIYPGWIPILREIFMSDSQYLVVFTGSIGIGKSTIAIYCMSYILYRILCLKDPWQYFELADAGKMAVSFFNLTRTLGTSRGFGKLHNGLMKSAWFYKHGGKIRGKDDQYMDIPLFDWKLSSPYSKGFGVLGEDLISGIMDEVDSPNESEGQRRRVLQSYEASVRRFESRFVRGGESISRFFLVASKQDELSFIETFVEEMKGTNKIMVIDKAQWEVKPAHHYSGEKFFVMVGDAYTPSRVIEDREEVNILIQAGKNLIEVPIELKMDFERDPVGSLRDMAGISVRGSRSSKLFPADRFISECFDETKRDPAEQNIVHVGLEDVIDYFNLINLNAIRVPRDVPRYIHLDTAFTNDRLGLAMSGVCGWTEINVETEDGSFKTDHVPVVETDFCIAFEARSGDRIPLFKIRKLILDLKRAGFRIGKFSADLKLASEDTTQILSKAGIECEYISLDKTMQPYMEFRNVVFEKRWVCHFNKLLYFELKNLEIDTDRNKVDHPKKVKDIEILDDGSARNIVTEGSKDVSDAVVGSVYQSIRNAKRNISVETVKNLVSGLTNNSETPGMKDEWFIDSKAVEKAKDSVKAKDSANHILSSLKKYNRGN